jgi:hypothetical protein
MGSEGQTEYHELMREFPLALMDYARDMQQD